MYRVGGHTRALPFFELVLTAPRIALNRRRGRCGMFVHGSVTNIDRYLESRRYTGKPRSPQVSTPVNFDRDLLPEPISAKRIRFMVLTVIAIWTAIGLMNTLQRIANTTDMRE